MNKYGKLILGTVQFGISYGINNKVGQVSKDDVFRIMDEAKVSGVQILDTAMAYGVSEQLIGEYHKYSKQKFKVITKFSPQEHLPVSRYIEDTLVRLEKKSLEVVLFHSFSDYQNNPNILKDLILEKKEGKIEHIGVSVYNNDEIEFLLNDSEVKFIQVPFNLLDNDSQRGDILKEAKNKGKVIHARSVFLQGLFYKDLERLPEVLQPLKGYLNLIKKVVKDRKLNMAELALNYVLAQPYIDGVLVGVDSVSQLKENVRAVEKSLSEELIQQIDSIKVSDAKLLNPVNWNL